MSEGSRTPSDDPRVNAFAAVTAAFASLGRICLALDDRFHVRHASTLLDDLGGAGTAERVVGRDIASLLGPDLFSAGGILREALARGERREGWRGELDLGSGPTRLVSVTAAPLAHDPRGACDPHARYLVVLRPAEEELGVEGAPTVQGGMIARAPASRRVLHLIESLESSDATILLTGESGTGKEIVARAVHARSRRRSGPFVVVNCGAIPSELLESELFGHVRGAFTGAVRDREGRFEAARGGTLFLDEIGDLPLPLQVKLLRVLQDRTFERVGETRPRSSDARIIAATHIDLRRATAEGRFREDLYYRLHIVPIELAPLRERREDIEPLTQHLLARANARNGRAVRLSPDALRVILHHSWPGNVRELENALEYGVAVCRGQTILPEDLPPEVHAPREPVPAPVPVPAHPPTRDEETTRLRAVLDAHHWNRSEAARSLGMSRTTLWRKMRELGLA
jgi:DNA-binding NtrC family response regulator